MVPGSGTPLRSNGDGRPSASETDVHESCQPLTVINATSSPRSLRQSGGGGGAAGGARRGRQRWGLHTRTCDPIVAAPAVSPPLPRDHCLLCGPHLANWPPLPAECTPTLFYTPNRLIHFREVANRRRLPGLAAVILYDGCGSGCARM